MWNPSNASWLDLAQRLQEATGYRCLIYPGNIYFTDEYGDAALLGSLPPTTMLRVGFAGLDFPEDGVIAWRSFHAPFFPDFVQAARAVEPRERLPLLDRLPYRDTRDERRPAGDGLVAGAAR